MRDISSTAAVAPPRTEVTPVDDLASVAGGALDSFSLGWMLYPMTADTFFRDHWEAEPFLVNRADSHYFVELPGLDAVDEIITTTASRGARSIDDGYLVRTAQDGVRTERTIRLLDNGIPDIQDVYRAYHAGYSVIVNHVDHRSGPVARLCRTLELALHHRVGANMYLTPQGSQGFPPHIDDHDVFILQLHGVKEWHVGNPPSDLPLAGAKGGSIEFRGDEQTYTLEPGDALYLPRGFPHEAVTGLSSSLHLTIGIHVYTWADLLSEALHLFAGERVDFRRGLPPGFLNTSVDSAHATKLVTDLGTALASNSLAERSKEALAARLLGAGKIPNSGQFHSIDAMSDLTHESVVGRVPGFLCRAHATSEQARIEFATNYVSGPLRLAPAMKFIEQHERFAVQDLPGQLSAEEKIDLIGRLVSEGLLTITTNVMEVASHAR